MEGDHGVKGEQPASHLAVPKDGVRGKQSQTPFSTQAQPQPLVLALNLGCSPRLARLGLGTHRDWPGEPPFHMGRTEGVASGDAAECPGSPGGFEETGGWEVQAQHSGCRVPGHLLGASRFLCTPGVDAGTPISRWQVQVAM